ncbi:hypothetical protein MUP77_16095, partial [Candidatus Bathyarchaeota archaeon]|nr:hypothetical protein [Candidatus Bathyarchaeota archaeon]
TDMTMMTVEEFDAFMIPKMKWVKVEVTPPWVWHDSCGIDNSKKYRETELWFEEKYFLWKIVMDGKEYWLSKACLKVLLEEYERRTHSFLKFPLRQTLIIKLKEARQG